MKVIDFDNLILQEKIFGLEIVDGFTKVLEVRGRGENFAVVGYGKAEIPKESIDGGVINDTKTVAAAIETACQQAKPKKVKRKYASVVLPDSKIFVRVVKFPAGMKKEEIRESIEWKAKDLIAMPLEKVYWDWHRLSEKVTGEIEVVISAVEKECADSYIETLKKLNVTPLYFDISGNAAARFLFQKEYKQKKSLLVRIDRNTTTLSLFLSGGVRYQTLNSDVVKGGYRNLIDYAAARLGVEKDEAEELILSGKNLTNEQKENLKKSFEVHFTNLHREINQIVDYYSQAMGEGGNSQKGKNFDGIYVYGKGATIFGLKEFFSDKSMKIKRKPDDSSSISPMLPFISRESLSEHLVLLGLGLRNTGIFREMRDINLVPTKLKKKYLQSSIYNSLNRYLRLIFWNLFIISFILLFSVFISHIYKNNAQRELEAVENVAKSPVNMKLRKEIEDLNEKASRLDQLMSVQHNWKPFFEEVDQAKIAGIVYDNILVTDDSDAWKAISGEKKVVEKKGRMYFVISGVASNRDKLQQFTENIENSDMFKEVKMPISNLELSENIEFSIYCFVNNDLLVKNNEN